MYAKMSIKSAKYNGEPCYIREDGVMESYIPLDIISHRKAYGAILNLSLKHMADFQMLMTEIICEKYDLNVDEVIETIHADPRFKDSLICPTIHSMGYFEEEDLAKKIPLKEIKSPS